MASYYDICEQDDLLLELSDAERGALWRAVILYRRGTEPGEGMMRSVRPAFAMIRAGIDAYAKRRREICEARQLSGRRGGAASAAKSRQTPPEAGSRRALPESPPPPSSPCNTPPVSPLRGNTAPRRRAAFVKPSLDEVRAYCRERRNQVDPEQFTDHYESNGWKIGGRSPMRDWKAAVRTWERNGFGGNGGGPKSEGKYDGLF